MKEALVIPALLLSMCGPQTAITPKSVALEFEDFPQNVATIDLGQTLTVDIAAANDDGAGVSWTCAGEACRPFLENKPQRAVFKASGITGTALLTATSRKDASVSRSLKVTVLLNGSPDQTCK